MYVLLLLYLNDVEVTPQFLYSSRKASSTNPKITMLCPTGSYCPRKAKEKETQLIVSHV